MRLVFELKMGVWVLKKTKNDKKTHKMTKKRRKNEQKDEKSKKTLQNECYKHINSACLTGGGRQKMGDRGKISDSK